MSERYLYMNGRLVPYSEATIHVQSNAVKYGTSVFEGLRAYWNESRQELFVFRLGEHCRRLFDSLKLMRMEHEFTLEELRHSVLETLRKNEYREDVHVRQTAYLAADGNVEATGPTGLAVDARPRKLAGKAALDICLLDSTDRLRLIRWVLAAFRGAHLALPGVTCLRARRARAHGAGAPWVQVDGELAGRLPMDFECLPAAVSVLAPR